jgi:hypothetical protein
VKLGKLCAGPLGTFEAFDTQGVFSTEAASGHARAVEQPEPGRA